MNIENTQGLPPIDPDASEDDETPAKQAEPAEYLRGNATRIWLYMADTWDVPLTDKQIELLVEWDSADPISGRELERDRRIEAIQGNRNPFVRGPNDP